MNIYQISAKNLASMNFVVFFNLFRCQVQFSQLMSGLVVSIGGVLLIFFVFIPYEKINQSSAVLIEALVMS